MTHAIAPLDLHPTSAPLQLVPHPATVPGAPVTISAPEMVRLSGVARERLRTWERRHGFPVPVRSRNGTRRYLAEDVRHVTAVSQLASNGVPLQEAISTVLDGSDTAGTLESLGAALDHAPTPAIAISGPQPLSVAWVNGATRLDTCAPVVGASLEDAELFGEGAREAIQALLIDEGSSCVAVTHGDWMGTFPTTVRSLAWRLNSVSGGEPVVVLVQLPEGAAQASAGPAASHHQQTARWAAGVREARRTLQTTSGFSSLQRSLRELAGAVGATDAFLALCRGSELRTASSVRGAIGARSASLRHCPDLVEAINDCEVDWLGPESIRALDLDLRCNAVAVPLTVGRESVGVIVLTFPVELALGDATRELLLGFGTLAAAVVQRERTAAAGAQAPARAAA